MRSSPTLDRCCRSSFSRPRSEAGAAPRPSTFPGWPNGGKELAMVRVVAFRIGVALLLCLAFCLLWSLTYEIVVAVRWAPSHFPSEGASRWALLRMQNADRSSGFVVIAWNHFHARLFFPATQGEALIRGAIAAGAVVVVGLAGWLFAFINRRQ